ncbi:MAG: chromosome segregation protein SMC [Candidatus Aenigmarchaeota archaeon]|nr:chromosome segregation protein SMC [Candidatus Aenigmarchaeota archaeon]
MARLERLVLQGFKSFKRKTSIPISPGFSAITGPNGSGKSNIGDAIAFVLGKSSSRALRAKKAEELIFHGSKSKEGAEYAQVVLYFDNSGGAIPLQEKEISIGRRINRNGVSTYRLNGRVVTRQQVVDLLSQAGIHPDGYNMIRQGDVNQLVDMDAVQRRRILDEIAGIKDYDEKREKASKELETVEGKVREAEILLAEKSSVMEKLRAERDAALEHQRLTQELEKVRESLLIKDYTLAKDGLDKAAQEAAAKEAEFKASEAEVARLDKELEAAEQSLTSLTKAVVEASGQLTISKKISSLQAGVEARKMRLAGLDRELERMEGMIERVSRIENRINPSLRGVLQIPGVKGVLADLVVVPQKYRVAVEVGAGGHLRDIVVDTMETAVRCVNFLKQQRLGRARFLPLTKIDPGRKGPLPPRSLGWLSQLVHFDQQYAPAMEFVFGRTAAVDTIETAKEIIRTQRVRMVSLDGDLVEASGAVMGGYYKAPSAGAEMKDSLKEKQQLFAEREALEREIQVLSKELAGLADKEKGTRTFDAEKERVGIDRRLEELRSRRRDGYERRLVLQQELGKLHIQKAKLEARFDNLKMQAPPEGKPPYDLSISALKQREVEAGDRLQQLGPVNMKSLQEFDALMGEFEEFKEKVDQIVAERGAILQSIQAIEGRRLETFNKTMHAVARHFREVYTDVTGGEAELLLENPANVETGLIIRASPPGKRLLSMDNMSGGEKTLTAFAFMFALQKHKPAPFYILDEADATLDRRNSEKVGLLLKKQSKNAQYIIISHNDSVVKEADQIYGVTMADGESKVLGVELPENN